MTPEALHAYLTRYHFSEDVVQHVVQAYLESKVLIRYPKAWGYTCARLARIHEEQSSRQLSRGGGVYQRGGEGLGDGTPNHLVDSLTPERVTIGRQELIRVLQASYPLAPRKRGRPRGDSWESWWQDYRALQRDTYHQRKA